MSPPGFSCHFFGKVDAWPSRDISDYRRESVRGTLAVTDLIAEAAALWKIALIDPLIS